MSYSQIKSHVIFNFLPVYQGFKYKKLAYELKNQDNSNVHMSVSYLGIEQEHCFLDRT